MLPLVHTTDVIRTSDAVPSHYLMRPTDEIKPIQMVEFLCHFRPEKVPGSSRADDPRVSNLFWIRPHHVAEGPLMRDLSITFDGTNLFGNSVKGKSHSEKKKNVSSTATTRRDNATR